jgi:hypothetical protein
MEAHSMRFLLLAVLSLLPALSHAADEPYKLRGCFTKNERRLTFENKEYCLLHVECEKALDSNPNAWTTTETDLSCQPLLSDRLKRCPEAAGCLRDPEGLSAEQYQAAKGTLRPGNPICGAKRAVAMTNVSRETEFADSEPPPPADAAAVRRNAPARGNPPAGAAAGARPVVAPVAGLKPSGAIAAGEPRAKGQTTKEEYGRCFSAQMERGAPAWAKASVQQKEQYCLRYPKSKL